MLKWGMLMSISAIKMGIIRFIYNVISTLDAFFANVKTWYILAMSIFILFVAFIIYLRQKKKLALLEKKRGLAQRIVVVINNSRGLERTLHDLLNIVRDFIEVRGYFFYILDKNNNQFILKAIKHADMDNDQDAASMIENKYDKKEEYLPSVTIPTKSLMSQPAIVKDGKVPLLEIPIKGGKGIVRIGPIKELPRKYLDVFTEYSLLLQPILSSVLEMEQLREKVKVQTVSNQAIHNFNDVTRGYCGTLKMTMGLSIKMIGAAGGAFLAGSDDIYELSFVSGLDVDAKEKFSQDAVGHNSLMTYMGNEEYKVLTKADTEYNSLPGSLLDLDMELFIMVRVSSSNSEGLAIFWHTEVPNIEVHRLTALQMMTKRMGDFLEVERMHEETAKSYIDILKMLVQTVDNLEPHSVGYSELMARFTGIIASEMRLDKKEIQDVVLAAYLSNIGLLGFSNDLLFKDGKYTDMEYETMKLHSEVGASIIEATIVNQNIANIIRHHHERIDGNGYPAGLKGDDIPLGSRIIAVVQTFLAKINGRKYRDPLPFDKALELLKSASGTQLDSAVVDALINWFEKKRQNPARKGRSLGACWEMRCVPISICKKCPAFQEKDRNCWEVDGVHCQAHGNKCDTCFVYTEYQSRKKPTKAL